MNSDRIKCQFGAAETGEVLHLAEFDGEVVIQRLPVAVGDLHPLDVAHLTLDTRYRCAEVHPCRKLS